LDNFLSTSVAVADVLAALEEVEEEDEVLSLAAEGGGVEVAEAELVSDDEAGVEV